MRPANRDRPPRIAVVAFAALVAAGCTTTAQRPPPSEVQRPTGDRDGVGQATADTRSQPYTAADVRFMSGMIHHHAQAVLMARWAPTHGASQAVRTLAERILVSQQDDIALMERWLRERNEPVPNAEHGDHAAMGHGEGHAPLMPGMLTDEQLAQLDRAKGAEFDRLFLTFMIQHHQGAVMMVEELVNAPGAAQEVTVFQFANDVSADQTAEIDRMTRMLTNPTTGGN